MTYQGIAIPHLPPYDLTQGARMIFIDARPKTAKEVFQILALAGAGIVSSGGKQ